MTLHDRLIAVPGATGFLGSHVALHLAERGARVRVVARNPDKAGWLADLGMEIAEADLCDPEAMTRALSGADAVVTTAALSTRKPMPYQAFLAANSDGTTHLMTAAAAAGVRRVVYVSTVAVYRTRLMINHDETTPVIGADGDRVGWSRLVTNWRYALSKAIGERRAWSLAKEHAIDLTVLRPGPIYGKRDGKLTQRYARWMGRAVAPAPTFRIPHVHAGDVARAIEGALLNPASVGRAYNVTGPSVSPFDMLRAWKQHSGGGPWLVPIPLPLWVDYDDSAAERDLGFKARSIREGVTDLA